MTMTRTGYRRAVMVSGAVVAAAVLGVVAFAVLRPEAARRVGESDPAAGLAPETPMDGLSIPPYVAALAVCAAMLVRTRRRPGRRPLWVLLAFVAAWLMWRELPWDERLLNDANTFSWAKYLGRPDVPVWAQVVLGGGSILATVLLVVYVARRARTIGRLLAEKVRSVSAPVFALGVLALGAAQAMDKYHTVDRHLGTDLAAWKAAGWLGYAEESLEAIGPLLLLVACILAVLEEPDAGGPGPAGGRGGQGGPGCGSSSSGPG